MKQYEKTGILDTKNLKKPTMKQLKKGVAIIECVQMIPCNPCVDSCPVNAISMKDINAPPICDYDKCIACGKCVGICPGLAIFVVKIKDDKGFITLPYEFLPKPKKDEIVDTLNRKGEKIGTGIIKKVKSSGETMVVTVMIDKKDIMDVRNIRVKQND